jgi:Zn-dependent peptidase ImmA (M78 family)/DNA-binding XRE family transcriptional regulator
MTTTYQPARLSMARRLRGLRKNEVAFRLGVQPAVLTKYEKEGEAEPAFETVQKLAEILQVAADFFFRPEPPDVAAELVTFRALSRMPAREKDRAVETTRLAIEISTEIEKLFEGLPTWDASPPDLPDSHASRPEEIARAVRAEWSLGDRKINNVVHLLESKGVRVFSLYDDPESIDAFTYWHEKTPMIFLNQCKSGQRSRFDACHELGHVILHRDADHTGKPAEVEANRFASAFLMPPEAVRATGVRNPGLAEIDRLRLRFGVSMPAMTYRLHTLGMITDWHYKSLSIQMSEQGLRSSEMTEMAHERSAVWPRVFAAMRNKGELNDFCTSLGVGQSEIAGLTFRSFASALPGGNPGRVPPKSSTGLKLVEG